MKQREMLSSGHYQEKSSPGVVLHGIIVIVLFPFLLSIQKELSVQSLMAAEPPEHISFPPPRLLQSTRAGGQFVQVTPVQLQELCTSKQHQQGTASSNEGLMFMQFSTEMEARRSSDVPHSIGEMVC